MNDRPHSLARVTRWVAAIAVVAVATFAGTFLATFETPLNGQGAVAALANHVPNPLDEIPCSEEWGVRGAQITEAVYDVTGNYAAEDACNPRIYNNGSWSTMDQLRTHVSNVVNSCNATSGLTAQQSRNLVLAVLEETGIAPEGAVCQHNPYSNWYAATCQISCDGINWSVWDDSGDLPPRQVPASAAVSGTFNVCGSRPYITQAVIQASGQIPNQFRSEWVNYEDASANGASGQCNASLYNNGVYYSYKTPVSNPGVETPRGLLEAVRERVNSRATCANASITQIYREITGWYPVVNSRVNECDTRRYGYGDGNWGGYADLKHLIAMSFRCRDPWINQIYAYDYDRRARGEGGVVGECSPGLYGDGYFGSGTYGDFRQKVINAQNSMTSKGISFDGSKGNLKVTQPITRIIDGNHVFMSANGVRVYRSNGIISDKGLGIISDGGAGILGINPGAPVIAAGGGNVIAAGGGNVLNLSTGNVIAQGALNVIAAGGGNVIAAGGGNVMYAGGGN